jgi:hypothetical protein
MPVDPAPTPRQPPRPLAIFLLRHCRILSYFALFDLHTNSQTTEISSTCPIYYTPLISLLPESPALKIALPKYRHIFCAACLSRHVLAGRNTCPLCRAVWFDIPPGATTAVSAAREVDDRVTVLESLVAVLTEEVELLTEELEQKDAEEELQVTEADGNLQVNGAETSVYGSGGRLIGVVDEFLEREMIEQDRRLEQLRRRGGLARIAGRVLEHVSEGPRGRVREFIRDRRAENTPGGSDDAAEDGNRAARPSIAADAGRTDASLVDDGNDSSSASYYSDSDGSVDETESGISAGGAANGNAGMPHQSHGNDSGHFKGGMTGLTTNMRLEHRLRSN